MNMKKFIEKRNQGLFPRDNDPFIDRIIGIMPKEVKDVAEFVRYPKNSVLVAKSEPVEYAFITITGEITVVNEFESGKIFEPVVIYESDFTCVVEIILGMDEIIATNMTKTDCEVIRIPRHAFHKWMKKNHEITSLVLYSVSDNFMKNMMVSGENILLDTMYLFLRHILNYAVHENGNYTLMETREKTSLRTGINLRTLYRHIKTLKEKELITIEHRNITYNDSQRDALEDYVYYLRNK